MRILRASQALVLGNPQSRLASVPVAVSRIEWFLAFVMVMFGVHMLIWPAAIAASRFAPVAWLIPPACFMLVCLLGGATRLSAIITAGRWRPWCGHVRAVGAGIGAFVWSQMAFSLFVTSWPIPSLGIWTYLAAAAWEFSIAIKALGEAKAHGP